MSTPTLVQLSHGIADPVTQKAVRQLEAAVSTLQAAVSVQQLLGIPQLLTAANGTYVPTKGTKRVYVEMMGAGGAGGGSLGGANDSAGGGGASGVYLAFWLYLNGANITGGAYTNDNVGGTGVSAGTGNNGGDAVVVLNGITYRAKGGGGGSSSPNAATTQAAAGAPLAGTSTVAGSITASQAGDGGLSIAADFIKSGAGGYTPWGTPGAGRIGSLGTGNAATGYGAGGGGATSQVTSFAGGQGAPSAIRIWEFPA